MALSQTALQGILASATTSTFLECLTIKHSEIDTVRLVNDNADINRTVGAFTRFPFEVRTPPQSADRPPEIQIMASAVDQSIIFHLRSLAGLSERATITYEVVLAESPNTVEFGPVTFILDAIATDGLSQVTLTASFLKGALNDAFPAQQFSPGNSG